MICSRESLRLYAVTDRHWLGAKTLAQAVEEALRGGATMVQLREKDLPDDLFLAEALAIKSVVKRYNAPLIVNDRVEIALACGADGVHLGQDDADPRAARLRLGPRKIIGVSAHSVAEAVVAERNGADYLGSGALFPTGTKDNAAALPLDELKRIAEAVSIPVVGIGGITADNLPRLKGTGLCGAAVVSALFAAPDVEASARRLRRLADEIFGA